MITESVVPPVADTRPCMDGDTEVGCQSQGYFPDICKEHPREDSVSQVPEIPS